MRKRMVWPVVSGLMVLSLIVASCAPKVTEEKKEVVVEKEVVTEKEVVVEKEVVTEQEGVEMVKDALGRLVEKPQYGGWLNIVDIADPADGFANSLFYRSSGHWNMHVTNERLIQLDELKGPRGTNEGGSLNLPIPYQLTGGLLAESWEIIQPDTLKFKIRKGVRWHNKPPTNGMELTAEDVVYSFMLGWTRPGWPRLYPYISNLKNPAESMYVHPNDPWAVVFKAAPGRLTNLWEYVTVMAPIVPNALGPLEGEGFVDWKGVTGTGSMILTDYVMGSSMTWKRNPNYWRKDPLHPENQRPYVDGMKMFIIPDLSTQYAALRTGKIDVIAAGKGVAAEDAQSLMRTTPELQFLERWAEAPTIFLRHDVAPIGDIRVRRALNMAIDRDEIVRDFYGGKAEKFYWPAMLIPDHAAFQMPLEQMPESVQELFTYHPDKAKQLLKEAGYPDGFTTSVLVTSAREDYIDLAAIVKNYWAKVGVTLKIDVREPGVVAAMTRAFSYEHGYFASTYMGEPTWFHTTRPGGFDYGRLEKGSPAVSQLVGATLAATHAAYFDPAEYTRVLIEATPKLHDLAINFKLPVYKGFSVWQPWLKDYHGETNNTARMWNQGLQDYVWIDLALKKSMGR